MSRIKFRDRALKKGEKSHYYCEECGTDIAYDLIYSHQCPPSSILGKLRLDKSRLTEKLTRVRI